MMLELSSFKKSTRHWNGSSKGTFLNMINWFNCFWLYFHCQNKISSELDEIIYTHYLNGGALYTEFLTRAFFWNLLTFFLVLLHWYCRIYCFQGMSLDSYSEGPGFEPWLDLCANIPAYILKLTPPSKEKLV